VTLPVANGCGSSLQNYHNDVAQFAYNS